MEKQSIEVADCLRDAGAMGCGELIIHLHLRGRVRALPPGGVLRLVAHEPEAIEALPAWYRLAGHTLVAAQHPVYIVYRKEV